MIFVTVGTQLPFDRLITTIDSYYHNKSIDVFAQIGPSEYTPKNIKYSDFITPVEVEYYNKNCSLVIAHAGTGSIFTAMKYKKPLIIMPRKASLGEHRNEHQLATIEWASDIDGVTVAKNEHDLINILESKLFEKNNINFEEYAQKELINFLKKEIENI